VADDAHQPGQNNAPEPGAPEPVTPGPDPDATRLQPPSGDADATTRLPARTGDTTIIPPVRPGETAMLPPVTDSPQDQGARWAARAGVPRAAADEEEEWVPTEESGSPWWLPLVLGIGGLILLALIGLGIWVAFHNKGNPAPAPGASPTQSATPSASPTPPPSPSPTASASPTAATVTLPDLRGVAVADAQSTLNQLGLNATIVDQPNSTVPAGTVIAMDPAAGGTVPLGTTVTLTVAVAPSPSPSPTPTNTVISPSPSTGH
jgi:hypothetical protein